MCVEDMTFGVSGAAEFTLPKLPLPKTMRKLKSWMPTLTLPGPGAWTGGQDETGVGDRAAGNDSDSGAGNA